MDERALMMPLQFRFTEADDVKRYGEGPYVYDEAAIVRLPARRLLELEAELGTTLINVMNGFRRDSVLGNLGGCWLALHLADPEKAGAFDDFSPVIMLLQFEAVGPGKERGTQPQPDTTPPPEAGSDPKPTVVLPIMPKAG